MDIRSDRHVWNQGDDGLYHAHEMNGGEICARAICEHWPLDKNWHPVVIPGEDDPLCRTCQGIMDVDNPFPI